MNKPTVRYIDLSGDVIPKFQARVLTLDHPKLGKKWITTSVVLEVTEGSAGPEFETLNTIYVPADIESNERMSHIIRDIERIN